MVAFISKRLQKTTALLLALIFYSDFVLGSYVQFAVYAFRQPVEAVYKNKAPLIYVNPFSGSSIQSVDQSDFFDKHHHKISGEQEEIGGPTQPEVQSFQSVNNSNMVDLFTGDFSYNIPLMDVGGYPVNISYKSGITMDQEASWVGLGWNINPGTITRNMRGLPDDFSGLSDSVRKTTAIKDNNTIGVTLGLGVELFGLPLEKVTKSNPIADSLKFSVGVSLGVFNNNYKGWGLEGGISPSISAGNGAKGVFTAGLSLQSNTQEGFTISPSLSYNVNTHENENKNTGTFSINSGFNTRSGLKDLQLSAGLSSQIKDNGDKDTKSESGSGAFSSSLISFSHPAYLPNITIPYTSYQFSFTGKAELPIFGLAGNGYITGYTSTQYIDKSDSTLMLPAYGYLNYQNSNQNPSALLDFNSEKDIPYRESPSVPHIGMPMYTYDAFSITGEGSGGMFRAYRGDIGFVYNHQMQTKDGSDRLSVDFGAAELLHGGVDLNINRAFTRTGPWTDGNVLGNTLGFRNSDTTFEASYFRNPGEKTVNAIAFYNRMGGDDVVTPELLQKTPSSSLITTTNNLLRYSGKVKQNSKVLLSKDSVYNKLRDKRAQVISYLTAEEASTVGLSKYIESYAINDPSLVNCPKDFPPLDGIGSGLEPAIFANENLSGSPCILPSDSVDMWLEKGGIPPLPCGSSTGGNNFSVRWSGYIKAPIKGSYQFKITSDDGVRLWLNDTLVINHWDIHGAFTDIANINFIAGQVCRIRLELFEHEGKVAAQLKWKRPATSGPDIEEVIPKMYLYPPYIPDTYMVDNVQVERRVNSFRKPNHISEIDVLNGDGRRYVYGTPAYNLKQKEVTFSVDRMSDPTLPNTSYNNGVDNSASKNKKGIDNYYSCEETPAYAHSFLLTAILSADYVDITGNGISDDDLGDAVKFNYSKVAGKDNPFKWRAPYVGGKATYNEGLKSYSRDDKANYVYGEKELWYMNSIESKNMVAKFWVSNRKDLLSMDEAGTLIPQNAKKLDSIQLFSKADLYKNGPNAIPIKTVHFSYTYELCMGINSVGGGTVPNNITDSGKLTLKSIWFTYNGNTKTVINPYKFKYNSLNPNYDSKAYDRWGNYKVQSQNPGYTTSNKITNADYPYALQDSTVAAQNAAGWALESVTLPSTGVIKVTYESDDYAYVQNKRACQMFTIAGFSSVVPTVSNYSNALYDGPSLLDYNDRNYVVINVPTAANSGDVTEVLRRYLEGNDKLFFRLSVSMPEDKWGSGNEYVNCYADIDWTGGYGYLGNDKIWFKIKSITKEGNIISSSDNQAMSPLAQAAIQFLRLNLPSKAYPGSETGNDLELADAVKMLGALFGTVKEVIQSYNYTARYNGWANIIDVTRSVVRLNSPLYKKLGGGHRVKKIQIFDNWKNMTDNKESVYGQQYDYTTIKQVNGINTIISSGVASYEPALGNEENPWHQPIEYIERISALAPTSTAYSEEPLGESFFPSAGVGYSKVRVRSINTINKKSANGYEETEFYTSYDFPTYTDRSIIDEDTKKRYKPKLLNFLRVSAYHYLTISQGFKVELNDMDGKTKSQATYGETDPVNPISYSRYYYKVQSADAEYKKLSSTAWVMNPAGDIDTNAIIGKDVEIMSEMREQHSITNGFNISPNSDLFAVGMLPILALNILNLSQREENIFRSASMVKIINRHGILDSVVAIDKGSRVSTKNILFDSETGEVLLSRTQNEFDDPIYNFGYPAHWAYDNVGPAYKNSGAVLSGVTILSGRIIASGLVSPGLDNRLFSSGDEVLIYSRPKTGGTDDCNPLIATFPVASKLWVVNGSVLNSNAAQMFFIDKDGNPFTGYDVDIKIIRSGRRNMNNSIGSITSLENPIKLISNKYQLDVTATTKIINASAAEYKQLWNVADKKLPHLDSVCTGYSYQAESCGALSCTCDCLAQLFNYLMTSGRLVTIKPSDNITVEEIVADANAAGKTIVINNCNILKDNKTKPFYALTYNPQGTVYRAQIGDCSISIKSTNGAVVNFTTLKKFSCGSASKVYYKGPDSPSVTIKFYMNKSMNVTQIGSADYGLRDTSSVKIFCTAKFPPTSNPNPVQTDAFSILQFEGLTSIPAYAKITSATLKLKANPGLDHLAPPCDYVDTDPSHHESPCTDAHSYDGDFYLIFLDTLKRNWNSGTKNKFFTADPNTTSGYSIQLTKTGGSQSFSTDVKNIVQQIVDRKTISNSFKIVETDSPDADYIFNANSGTSGFTTFYSERYSVDTLRPSITVTYDQYDPSDTIAVLAIDTCFSCSTTLSCNSAITASAMNPYKYGILGNVRANKSYVYYSQRAETDPSTKADIRKAGTYADFSPYWKFTNSKLSVDAALDTTLWVWNSEMTFFNQKGFELENKDPLGRFNCGLYGYGNTVPVAVVQNAHYREVVFDGFEDYGYGQNICDTSCSNNGRHNDFSAYGSYITTEEKHTGRYSIKVPAYTGSNTGSMASLTVPVITTDNNTLGLNFSTVSKCSGNTTLTALSTTGNPLLPGLSFMSGKYIFSVWVKERKDCLCKSYAGNKVVVIMGGAGNTTISSTDITPSGVIIEGWQRYESVIDVPTNAVSVTFGLRATGDGDVYFDDIRVLPFSSNMKSFVYHPVNMRLMAELDENNYATLYEYDDDGTLVRVKKETQRGIMTIKETRSYLRNNPQ